MFPGQSGLTYTKMLMFIFNISCLAFSNFPGWSIVLTFQHATLKGNFFAPDFVVRISLVDDLGPLTQSSAERGFITAVVVAQFTL